MLFFGWNQSPSANSAPNWPASSVPIVVLPDPETPMTTSTSEASMDVVDATADVGGEEPVPIMSRCLAGVRPVAASTDSHFGIEALTGRGRAVGEPMEAAAGTDAGGGQ